MLRVPLLGALGGHLYGRRARLIAMLLAAIPPFLVAAGEIVTATVSQSELRMLPSLQAKADRFREKLEAVVRSGAKVEPGPLQLRTAKTD